MHLRYLVVVLLILFSDLIFASATQKGEPNTSLPYASINLQDIKEFKKIKGKSWGVAGSVYMNRHLKFHAEGSQGSGILTNRISKRKSENIYTKLEHGDIDIELDFMLANGTKSGVFLQSRYEIQLIDSWNKESATPLACGSIIGSNESNGKSSLLNACKAPGLWNHLSVSFKAPRFDQNGKKIKNAIFKQVMLNGKVIHEDIEVPGPSHSSAIKDEPGLGSLMFQAEQGPVAFRNIQYKVYSQKTPIVLSDINFDVYKGLYKKYDTLKSLSVLRTGKSDSLSWRVGDRDAQMAFRGILNVPRDGEYLFQIKGGGPAWFLVDNKEVVDNNGTRDYTKTHYGNVHLSAGKHDFRLIYANSDESLVLKYEGPGIPVTPLTTPSSERKVHISDPLEIILKNKAIIQRGFLMHHGKVNPYAMAVGIPGGLNYAYDLNTYNILSAWRDRFIDVSNMWTERGESQREIPLGAVVEFPKGPLIGTLSKSDAVWTNSVEVDNSVFEDRGYRIDENGFPVFLYSYENVKTEDYLLPSKDQSGIVREVKAEIDQPAKNIYFLIGSGKSIEKLPNGAYAVNDKQYYIESFRGIDEKQLLITKALDGNFQLLLPISQGNKSMLFNYSIVW